jgi:Domain of unknown function (DU1801)
MAENKTVATSVSVSEYIAGLESEQRRDEAATLVELMARASGFPAVMWGTSIIGFGSYRYAGAAGREGDWMIVGFSPRKAAISLYGLRGAYDGDPDFATSLGKHTHGKGCIYAKRLTDIDLGMLENLVADAMKLKPHAAKE